MKLKGFGEKITEVEKEIGKQVEYYIERNKQEELLNFIVDKLRGTVIEKDLIKTLAIIDYITHNSDISGEQLPITHSISTVTESLCDTAYSMGNNDLAIELSGLCKALHYIEAE